MRIFYILPTVIIATRLFLPLAYGEDMGGIVYSGSGFSTLEIGKMIGGTRANVEDYNCPCFISDYAHAGVYDGRSSLQWMPDSKFGVQGSASISAASITAQVVALGSTGTAELEWLYGSYNVNDNITVQAGRKRLPMFFYSDVQDIGIALPWTHLPPGPYGWEVVNYNGINIRYQDRWGSWAVTSNLLAGSEHNSNSGYWKIYNGRQSKSEVKWTNIVGGDLSVSRDWLEARMVYIQSDTEENNTSLYWDPTTQTYGPAIGALYPQAKQQIYGLSVNSDYQNWLIRSEVIQINHPGLTFTDHAQLLGVGYRYGQWQPMFTWSQYKGSVTTSGAQSNSSSYANNQRTISLTLRYDLTSTSDLKVQYDNLTDHSDPLYTPNYGNSTLLTFAYDAVY
jgi:hypothetical protein